VDRSPANIFAPVNTESSPARTQIRIDERVRQEKYSARSPSMAITSSVTIRIARHGQTPDDRARDDRLFRFTKEPRTAGWPPADRVAPQEVVALQHGLTRTDARDPGSHTSSILDDARSRSRDSMRHAAKA